jgi:hypothetical protein
MSPIEWLCDKSISFKELAPHDQGTIMHFTLLWSYFEDQALDNSASLRKIVDFARRVEGLGRLKPVAFEEDFAYFQDRYFQNGDFTWHFDGLFHQHQDKQALDLVRAVLSCKNTNNGDRIAAFLLIIYRLRNRLMHGDKWDEDLGGQIDNFTHANNVLMKTLDAV